MPKYYVRLCYSGYFDIDDIHADNEAEAVEKAEAIVHDTPFTPTLGPSDLQRWADTDEIEEVAP